MKICRFSKFTIFQNSHFFRIRIFSKFSFSKFIIFKIHSSIYSNFTKFTFLKSHIYFTKLKIRIFSKVTFFPKFTFFSKFIIFIIHISIFSNFTKLPLKKKKKKSHLFHKIENLHFIKIHISIYSKFPKSHIFQIRIFFLNFFFFKV